MAQTARWTLAWRDRPREEAVHFNPAYCGDLIARTVREYHRLAKTPLSLPLAFVVLPLTLHPPTRHALPGKANTTFGSWSAEHHVVLSEIPDRVMRLRPVTREALLFLTQVGAVVIRDGGILPGDKPLRSSVASLLSTAETDQTRRAAGLLGRWFANQATAATVLQTMGVTL